MNSKERVLTAIDYGIPDRVPVHDGFWPEFVDRWRAEKQLDPDADIMDYYGLDIAKITPNETPFPSQRGVLEESGEYVVQRDGWGMVKRSRKGAWYYDEVGVVLENKADIGKLEFDSPTLDSRFAPAEQVEEQKRKRCAFIKTGGPYLRTSNLRGATQWLIDIAEDPGFARELAMMVTDHITAVGLEAMRRYDLYDTGIWFFDDMAWNEGPMVSPRSFEQIFLPCYAKMCEAYHQAGVKRTMLHSDGNIRPVLDMMVDVGITSINPVEPRAGMHIGELRQRYGKRLAYIGGLCNAHILPKGTKEEIETHVREVLRAGEDGGLVIGTHSIGPDIPVESYDHVHELLGRYGVYGGSG